LIRSAGAKIPSAREESLDSPIFPFGGGPRVCVGAAFAMLEATLLLAMIQQKFHLDLVHGHPVQALASVTLRPKHGIRVTVHRRASST